MPWTQRWNRSPLSRGGCPQPASVTTCSVIRIGAASPGWGQPRCRSTARVDKPHKGRVGHCPQSQTPGPSPVARHDIAPTAQLPLLRQQHQPPTHSEHRQHSPPGHPTTAPPSPTTKAASPPRHLQLRPPNCQNLTKRENQQTLASFDERADPVCRLTISGTRTNLCKGGLRCCRSAR